MYIIYKTTNKINDKFYIGKTTDNDNCKNYLGSGTVFKLAIKKHGRENFIREDLFFFDDEAECYLKEAELVTEEQTNDPQCYNIITGGMGGRVASAETRQKMSDTRTGRKHSPEHAASIKAGLAGKNCRTSKYVVSDETKKKISDGNMGKVISKETREKLSKINKGREVSPETRRKISETFRKKREANQKKTQ
jgi:hypothetical protein